jgi:hypothetical protein
VKNWIILADDLLAQIKAMANGADEKSTKETVRGILDERFANNIVNPPSMVNSQSLQAAWGQVEVLLPKMQQLTGHPFLLTGTNWLDEVLAVISRWKEYRVRQYLDELEFRLLASRDFRGFRANRPCLSSNASAS